MVNKVVYDVHGVYIYHAIYIAIYSCIGYSCYTLYIAYRRSMRQMTFSVTSVTVQGRMEEVQGDRSLGNSHEANEEQFRGFRLLLAFVFSFC